jgi:hypothetical protein
MVSTGGVIVNVFWAVVVDTTAAAVFATVAAVAAVAVVATYANDATVAAVASGIIDNGWF